MAPQRSASPDDQVTVVIPAYKAQHTIRRAVDSALEQPGVNVRVAVVVDGLLDRTADELDGYDSRVSVLVNPENRGAQVSRNMGLATADSEYVMFLDADDFLEGPILAGLAEKIQVADADVGFGPMQRLIERTGKRGRRYEPDFSSATDLFRRWTTKGGFVAPCSILWRTAFIREIGGWDESVVRNQDGEVVLRGVLRGARFVTSSEGCGIYVQHYSDTRMTARSDNLGGLMAVADKLLSLDSEVIPAETRGQILGTHFYNLATRFYSRGRDDLGQEALRRSRELGFRGHNGPVWHRVVATLMGVRLRYRVSNFIRGLRPFGFQGLGQ